MDRLLDSTWRDRRSEVIERIDHPAGPVLSLVAGRDSALVPPGLCESFRTGDYCGAEARCLRVALDPDDRVLDVGAGLGVAAALAAPRVRRVLAIEADPRIVPVARRLLEGSGAGNVELLHGIPSVGRKGRGPVFLRDDFRRSSRSPGGDRWRAMALVPFLPLNAILADVAMSVVLCDIPFGAASLLSSATLTGVDRIMLTRQPDTVTPRELDESLAARGFFPDPQASAGRVTLYRRLRTGRYAAALASAGIAIPG